VHTLSTIGTGDPNFYQINLTLTKKSSNRPIKFGRLYLFTEVDDSLVEPTTPVETDCGYIEKTDINASSTVDKAEIDE
jgi:hypothetical protein